jgi:hypothetical protein
VLTSKLFPQQAPATLSLLSTERTYQVQETGQFLPRLLESEPSWSQVAVVVVLTTTVVVVVPEVWSNFRP